MKCFLKNLTKCQANIELSSFKKSNKSKPLPLIGKLKVYLPVYSVEYSVFLLPLIRVFLKGCNC